MVEPQSHAGRVAIVTGAARGIGQRIAVKLAARGASLVLVDLDQPGETAAWLDKQWSSMADYIRFPNIHGS